MEARSLILDPAQYTQVSAYDLLCAAEEGFIGIDHRFLHALVDDPEKSIPDLVRFGLEERHAPGRTREDLGEDLLNIFRHLRTPQAIPYLLEHMRRRGVEATYPLIRAFSDIGPQALEPLLDFFEENKNNREADAGFLLASFGVRDGRILEALTALLETDPGEAAHCLTIYGDPAAIPAMREAIAKCKDKGEPWMERLIERSVEELEASLQSREEDVEDEPFDLWERYPAEDDPNFGILTEKETELFLDSPDAGNRLAAVVALSTPDAGKRLWDRLFQMAREDPAPRVRGGCWEALRMGWDRDDIRQAMRACLAGEAASPEERGGALVSLAAREGATPEVERAIRHFYEDPATRAKALEAMTYTQEPKFEQYFSKHLDDPDTAVCIQAIAGIGLNEMVSEAPRLASYFEDEELRFEALSSYAMAAMFEPTRAGVRRLYRKITDLAHGLSEDEEMAIKDLLNSRARGYDLEPVYGDDGEELIEPPVQAKVKAGRNDPCPCGSGKKYKKCCGA